MPVLYVRMCYVWIQYQDIGKSQQKIGGTAVYMRCAYLYNLDGLCYYAVSRGFCLRFISHKHAYTCVYNTQTAYSDTTDTYSFRKEKKSTAQKKAYMYSQYNIQTPPTHTFIMHIQCNIQTPPIHTFIHDIHQTKTRRTML